MIWKVDVMKNHSISQIFESVMFDFEKVFAKDEGRPDEIGLPRERQVRDFLRLLLPEKIGVSKGYVINQAGNVSKECDIVFFNKETCPKFILDADQDLRLFPIEEIYGVAEVKSTLDPDELENALVKLDSVNEIYRKRSDHISDDHLDLIARDNHTEPFRIVFSYKPGTYWLDFEFQIKLHGMYSPDAVFLLNDGAYIKATDDTIARRDSFSKKTSLQISKKDEDVFGEIIMRFACEDRSRHYDDFLQYKVKGAVLLLTMYTYVLDATKRMQLPDYDSGDYIVFWARSKIAFNAS